MKPPCIVVIGTAATGLEALQIVLASLPEGFPGAVFVVMHQPCSGPDVLAGLLATVCRLEVRQPEGTEEIQAGKVYLAPADHHLLVEEDRVVLTRGPKRNRFRPSIDVLFRSAAYGYGSHVIAVLLADSTGDGTSGLEAVKRLGGIAIVQDPSCAEFHVHRLGSRGAVPFDYCLPVTEISALVARLSCAATDGLP